MLMTIFGLFSDQSVIENVDFIQLIGNLQPSLKFSRVFQRKLKIIMYTREAGTTASLKYISNPKLFFFFFERQNGIL